MAAVTFNLPVIEQGATYKHTLVWQDGNGLAIDMTGCTAKMQVRPSVASPDILIELSTTNGRISIIPLDGRISLYVSDEDTAVLTPAKAVYDLEIYLPNGEVIRLIEGKVTIKAEVTR